MKRTNIALAMFMMLLMLLTAACARAEIGSGTCGDNLTWRLDDEGTLTISGSGSMKNYTANSLAPWYGARGEIRQIVLEEGVTSIGFKAFQQCSGMMSVILPDSLKSIECAAFEGCSGLTSVTIPQSVTSIGDSAFSDCGSLTDVTFPDGLESIGNDVFFNCSSLRCATIPENVKSMGEGIFFECSSLVNVTIPDSVTCIGGYTFYGCNSLTSITIPAGVTKIEEGAFQNCNSLTNVTIPAGVTSIGGSAFYGCSRLISVTIPAGVKMIEDWTFYGCSSLKRVTVPEGVTSIGSSTFERCSGITDIAIPAGVKAIENRTFYGCSGLKSVTIPEGVTRIGDGAFEGCSGLIDVVIPAGVKEIENRTFYGCSDLEAVTIPEGVTSIGDYAFRGCANLVAVTIPERVTSIGEHAFSYCTQAEITLPDGITSVGSGAFSGVKKILCNSKTTTSAALGVSTAFSPYGAADFTLYESEGVVYVDSYTGSKENVLMPPHAMRWSTNTAFDSIRLPSTLDEDCCFSLTATSVTVPDGVVDLGTLTLKDVERIYIPESVQVFYGLTVTGARPVIYCSDSSPVQAWARFNGFETVSEDWNGLCTLRYQGEIALDVGESVTLNRADFAISPIPADYRGELALSSAALAVDGLSVTALEPGNATVTATMDSRYSVSIPVHVYQPVSHIALMAPSICQAGQSFTVSVQALTPEDVSGKLTWIQDGAQAYEGTGTSLTLTAPEGQSSTVIRVTAPSGAYSEVTVRVPMTISTPYLRSDVVELGSTLDLCVDVDGETFVNDPLSYGGIELGSAAAGLALEDGVVRATGLGTVTFRVKGLSGSWVYLTVTVQDMQHAYRTQVPAVEPTCAEPGIAAYEICRGCGRFFNAEGEEIEEGSWVLPVTHVHHLGDGNACRDCAQTFDTTGLDVITLPDALSVIMDEAFAGVTAQVIILPQGCETISERAFADCRALQYVFLPATIEGSFPRNAFDGCEEKLNIIFR